MRPVSASSTPRTRAPLFQTKCHERPGEGAAGHRPQMRHPSWGRVRDDVGRLRLEARKRVLHRPFPTLGSQPAGSSRRPHPPPRELQGPRAQGGGDTRASEALKSPLSLPSAYLCYGSLRPHPKSQPRLVGGSWGSPGSQPAAASHQARGGRGQDTAFCWDCPQEQPIGGRI